MERWAAKILAAGIIFVTMTIAGLLPIKVNFFLAYSRGKVNATISYQLVTELHVTRSFQIR